MPANRSINCISNCLSEHTIKAIKPSLNTYIIFESFSLWLYLLGLFTLVRIQSTFLSRKNAYDSETRQCSFIWNDSFLLNSALFRIIFSSWSFYFSFLLTDPDDSFWWIARLIGFIDSWIRWVFKKSKSFFS